MPATAAKALKSATRALLGQAPGFTPGPYSTEQRGEHFFAVLGHNPDHGKQGVSYGGAHLTVCTTDSREEADRIALCLSVHDDMLAALKAAVARADENRPGYSGRTEECQRDYQACVDAIAKAEGRS